MFNKFDFSKIRNPFFGLVVAALVVMLIIWLLYPIIGAAATMVTVVLPVTMGLLFGTTVGVIASLFTLPISLSISYIIEGHQAFDYLGQIIPATTIYLFIAWFAGRQHILSKKLREQVIKNEEINKELNDSNKRLEDIMLSSVDWVWEVDNEGRVTFVSDNVEQAMGYTPEEMIGKTPFDFMPKQEGERLTKLFFDLAEEKKKIVNMKNLNLTKDGQKVVLLTNGVPIVDSQGKLIGYRGVNKDITEQESMRLRKNRERKEVERMNKLMVGRELRMSELKKENDELKEQIQHLQNK